jgi:phage shock protein A
VVRLEEKLVDAKTRQQAILSRQRTATRRLDARKRLHNARIDDALIRFDQFERRIDDIESHVEAYDIGKKPLKDEFSELETEDAVAQELRELKSKRAGQKRGGESA